MSDNFDIQRGDIVHSVPEYLIPSFIGNVCDGTDELLEIAEENIDTINEGTYLRLMNIAAQIRRHIRSSQVIQPTTLINNTDTQNNFVTRLFDESSVPNISTDDNITNNRTENIYTDLSLYRRFRFICDAHRNISNVCVSHTDTNINERNISNLLSGILSRVGKDVLQVSFNNNHFVPQQPHTIKLSSVFSFTFTNKITNYSSTSQYILPSVQTTTIPMRYDNSNRLLNKYVSSLCAEFRMENNSIIINPHMRYVIIPHDIYDELTYDDERTTNIAMNEISNLTEIFATDSTFIPFTIQHNSRQNRLHKVVYNDTQLDYKYVYSNNSNNNHSIDTFNIPHCYKPDIIEIYNYENEFMKLNLSFDIVMIVFDECERVNV